MQKLSIYIPMNHKESLTEVRATLRDLARIVGGSSSQTIEGAWLNKFQVLVTDPITVVYTLAPEEKTQATLAYLKMRARNLTTTLNQEAVLVTVEDVKEVYFIS